MTKVINWTHLVEQYSGQWVALAGDETTVLTAGDTAQEVHTAAQKKAPLHFLYHVPQSLDLFAGYEI